MDIFPLSWPDEFNTSKPLQPIATIVEFVRLQHYIYAEQHILATLASSSGYEVPLSLLLCRIYISTDRFDSFSSLIKNLSAHTLLHYILIVLSIFKHFICMLKQMFIETF